MKSFLKLLQAMGLLLVGMGLFHGMFDSDPKAGMWEELWYLLAGAGIFYGSTMFARKK